MSFSLFTIKQGGLQQSLYFKPHMIYSVHIKFNDAIFLQLSLVTFLDFHFVCQRKVDAKQHFNLAT